MRTIRLSALVVAVSAAMVGCTVSPGPPLGPGVSTRTGSGPVSGNPAATAGTPAATPSRTSAAAPPTASSPVPPAAADGVITLAFGGDVHFERHVRALLDVDDGLAELRPLLGGADVAVVNLETAITTRGTAMPKTYTFRTPPSALTTLAKAGVDAVSLANNHGTDFGTVGITDSLAAKSSSPIPVIGFGKDADEAFAPAVFDVRGTSVAVIASTQVLDHTQAAGPTSPGVAANSNPTRLLAAVARARAAYDVVVVFLHWGTERTVCPDGAQVATAKALEAAGADVIVGGHHHRVLGAGWLGRAYVGYGLGNFVWWLNSKAPGDIASGVLTVSVDAAAVRARKALPPDRWVGLRSVVIRGALEPLTISARDGVPRPAADRAAREAAWVQSRGCTGLRGSP